MTQPKGAHAATDPDPDRRIALIAALEQWAQERPDEIALSEPGGAQLGWHALALAVRSLAARIEAVAGCPTDTSECRTALLDSGNRIEVAISCLAALASGWEWLPVNPESTASELEELAQRVPIALVFDSDETRAITQKLSAPRMDLKTVLDGTAPDAQTAQAPEETTIPCRPGGAILLQSSGTTGPPKVARRPAQALDADGENIRVALALGPHDVLGLSVPLYHSYGLDMLFACLLAGCTTEIHRRFTPTLVRRGIDEGRITVWPCVPLMMDSVSRQAVTFDPDAMNARRARRRLRRVISAGSPLPRDIAERFEAHFDVPVSQLYGASEFGSVSCGDPSDPGHSVVHVGKPFPGVQFRVAAATAASPDAPLAPGQEGELWVAAPSMMSGYRDAPADFQSNGFLRTGDLARLDGDGRLTLTGRLKHLIDIGAQKVNPLEIEMLLVRHPDVAEAVVLPIPFSDTASRLKAIVIPELDGELDCDSPDLEVLRRFAREHLAPFKVPRQFEVRRDVPRSATGKILRPKLLAEIESLEAAQATVDTTITGQGGGAGQDGGSGQGGGAARS